MLGGLVFWPGHRRGDDLKGWVDCGEMDWVNAVCLPHLGLLPGSWLALGFLSATSHLVLGFWLALYLPLAANRVKGKI